MRERARPSGAALRRPCWDRSCARPPCLSFPARHADARAFPGWGLELELIHQATRAGKPEAQPRAGRIAVLQSKLEIRDARALIDEVHPETLTNPVLHAAESNGPTAAILQSVS